jgi:hypothetical protein
MLISVKIEPATIVQPTLSVKGSNITVKQLNHLKPSAEPLDIYVLEMGIFVCNLREAAKKRASGLSPYQENEPLVIHPSFDQRWPMIKSK